MRNLPLDGTTTLNYSVCTRIIKGELMKQCPKCKDKLISKKIAHTEVDECHKCKGVWFDKDELRHAKDETDSDLNWMDFEIWKYEDQFKSPPCILPCPVCNDPMVSIEYGESKVLIDYCPACKGTWLDRNEFKKIIDALENELLTKSFSDYIKEAIKEGVEIVSGHESFTSEWKDFTNILRFMQYRLFVEKPTLLNTIISTQKTIQ